MQKGFKRFVVICLFFEIALGGLSASAAEVRHTIVTGKIVLCDSPSDDFACRHPHALTNARILYKVAGSSVLQSKKVDAFGNFSLSLRPGEYKFYVNPKSPSAKICTIQRPPYCPAEDLIPLNNDHGSYNPDIPEFRAKVSSSPHQKIQLQYYERSPV